jgi:cyclopropane fatty-acyl-phospholipid synthase-like methyltransferase
MSTREKQYAYLLELQERKLGLMMNRVWDNDPRRLAFVLSRYKFVAKMFENKNRVLEIGCGDAWPSRIVAQAVKHLTVSDFDPVFINDALSRHEEKWPMEYLLHNMVEGPTEQTFDAIYLCDVFEHISPADEDIFLRNIILSTTERGALIIGIPSLQSQELIPEPERDPGHVNCKTGAQLKTLLEDFFHNVFLFSMNDEMVHTGHSAMAHYLFCVCATPIKREH